MKKIKKLVRIVEKSLIFFVIIFGVFVYCLKLWADVRREVKRNCKVY